MLTLWFEFIACSAAIVVCGTYLSKYGDVIAEKTGLGRAWIGLVLMAGVTSLPELINGISSVTVANVPDIAVGDIMGSCMFNVSLIALMDMFSGPGPIFSKAEKGHIISAGFGIILIGVCAVSLLAGQFMPVVGSIGLYTPVLAAVYLVGMKSVYIFEKRRLVEFAGLSAEAPRYAHVSVREAVLKYAVNAAVIVVAATLLPFIGDRIAVETGLGRSFVGTFFIGMTTSLPELVVSVAALRIGAAEMAIANLFGSNMFNILIIAVDDIFYTKGSLLADVSADHAITALIAMIMTGIAVVSLTYRLKSKTFLRLGWDTVAIVLAYIVSIILLYSMRGA
ncbi:MAG: sodium:calcium antiporter [Deltaproteobacteria bacterium]|nr:sodium:calcium antiporter [Deltaproteobacteria bacterium]